MNDATIFSLPSNSAEMPIGESDAILVLRRNGDIIPMTIGFDENQIENLRQMDVEKMNEEELDVLLQGQKLFLLTMAACNDDIMQFLAKLANMPGENDLAKMRAVATQH